MMKLVIIGPQGSGKGTQAAALSKHFHLPLFVTGSFFRRQVAEGTPLGKQIQTSLNQGHLVSDDIVFKVMTDEVCPLTDGWILDGTPRRLSQAKFIDEHCGPVTAAIFIEISDKEAVRRIAGRLYSSCGSTFHEIFLLPKKPNVCDACGDRLTRRADDRPEAIQRRLASYHQWTKPLANYYADKGALKHINGEQSIPDVFQEILAKLNTVG